MTKNEALKLALELQPDHIPATGKMVEQEPFGYFKAEPFGWVDCAETDEGAKALYEAPPKRQPLTEEQVTAAIDRWFSKEFEYNSSMETRMRAAIEASRYIKGAD